MTDAVVLEDNACFDFSRKPQTMKTYLECFPCFVRQVLDFCKLITDDSTVHEEILRKALLKLSKLDMTTTPPHTATQMYRFVKEITGTQDPFAQIKIDFNNFALDHLEMLQEIIDNSDDKLETAINLSMAGNIIDMGVGNHISEDLVKTAISEAIDHKLNPKTLAQFRSDISSAKNILYLGDNCGEIAFDKLLVEQLPKEKVTFAVRGLPIINDATMEDAKQVGMDKLVRVIDNSADVPGTILEWCSESFQQEFAQADVIISKGQGNYETLSENTKNIYFILKAKCPVIASHLETTVGDSIFIRQNK